MSTIIQIHTPYLFASLWNFRKLRSDVAVKNSRGESKKTNLLWTTIMFSEKIWSQIKILSLATCLPPPPPPPPPPQLLTKSKPFLKERKGSWACYTKNRFTTIWVWRLKEPLTAAHAVKHQYIEPSSPWQDLVALVWLYGIELIMELALMCMKANVTKDQHTVYWSMHSMEPSAQFLVTFSFIHTSNFHQVSLHGLPC